MSVIKATRIPQIVINSPEYVFVGQAVNISRRILPAYSSKLSKKKYKQYQLFVILLCKAWRNVGYRDVVEMISSNPASSSFYRFQKHHTLQQSRSFQRGLRKGSSHSYSTGS